MRSLIIALVAGGCASAPQGAPNLTIAFDPSIADPQEQALIRQGMLPWQELGFVVGDSAQPECGWYWFDAFDPTDPCTIRLHAQKLDGPSRARAHFRGAIIEFDLNLSGYDLFAYASHEIGHIVLHTLEHLPLGESGVMSSERLRSALTEADRAFACATARLCE